MMKKLLLLPVALMAFATAMGQDVKSESIKVGTVTTPGFTILIEKSANLVSDALEQRLKDANLKTKKSEGFVAALDQLFAEIAPEPINFYTKVEKDSKNSCLVTVCVIPTDLTADREVMQGNLRAFLQNLVQYVNRFEAKNNMEAEQDNLKKAQKKQASAVGAVEKLDKKIANKRKDIEKYKEKIKECEEDIKKLEADITKDQDKKSDAQKTVEQANENVKNAEGEVEKYRQLAE